MSATSQPKHGLPGPESNGGESARAVRVAGAWYARTEVGTLGPLSAQDLEAFLRLLDRVAAARGEIRG